MTPPALKGIPETFVASKTSPQIRSILSQRQKAFGIRRFASIVGAAAVLVWLIVPGLRPMLLGLTLAVLCANFLLHLLQKLFSLSDAELLTLLLEINNR